MTLIKKFNIDPAIKAKTEDFLESPVIVRVRRFTESSCQSFAEQIDKAVNSGQPFVPIAIDSYGGHVYSLIEMINKMQNCGLPCHTFVEGKAMSCGAVLFAMGSRRFMSPHATLMLHEVSSMSTGKTEEIKNDAKETDRLNRLVFRLMARNCGKRDDFFLKLIHSRSNTDFYLTAEQAKRLRICTDIGTPMMSVDVSVSYRLEKI